MKQTFRYLFIIFIFSFSLINVKADEVPDVSSKNVILYNLNDDSVIYEKKADDKVNIASLTKIMTAIVAIENIDDFDKKIIVTSDMIKGVTDDLSVVGFKPGEIITYNDLLYGTLLKSGADATNILAINISGSIDNFVQLMNDKARILNMNNSSFSNTIGIEGLNHYSSARDISILLKYALKNKKFKEMFTTKSYITTNKEHDMNGPLERMAEKDEINFKYIKGAKTGYTSRAGLCLASIATYNDINYLLVIIGADYDNKTQHIEDSKKIYKYFFDNYEYKTIISKGDEIVKLKNIYGKEYIIVSDVEYKSYLKKSFNINNLKYQYIGKKILDKDISKGDKIGSYYIKYDDEILYTKNIISPANVEFDLLFFVKENIFLVTLFVIFTILLLISIFRIKNAIITNNNSR